VEAQVNPTRRWRHVVGGLLVEFQCAHPRFRVSLAPTAS
jgi:hypothetical protein